MRSDGNDRDDLVEPEGVNAGRPVTDRPVPGPGDGKSHRTDGPLSPDPSPSGDNGQLLSGEDASRTTRPAQPGQELQEGEG